MLAALALLGCAFDSSGKGIGASGESAEGSTAATSTATTMPTPTSEGTTSGSTTAGAQTTTDDPSGMSDTTMSPTSAGPTSGEPACETTPRWWNDAWSHRIPLTVDNTSNSASLTDVPIMVRLDEDRIDYAVSQAGGADIRIIDGATGMPLPFEIELWNDTEESYVWFRLPSLPDAGAAAPVVWLYFGNPDASDAQSAAQVWASGFESVHHLTGITDSADNGHDAVSDNPPELAEGMIGGAREFDGGNEYLQIPPEAAFDFTDNFTVEVVVRRENWTSSWQVMVAKSDETWRVQRHNNTSDAGFGANNDAQSTDLRNNYNLDEDVWYYVAATYANGTKTLYVEDNVDSQPLAAPLRVDNVPVRIGEIGSGGRNWNGLIDEVRISTVARSAEWIAVQRMSLFDELLSFGPEETCG